MSAKKSGKKNDKRKVNLALQGGGAHGALTWGILDRFLEKDDFTIHGISATSAGAMNAVVLAQGMLDGGNEGARKSLHEFWHSMSEYGKKLNTMAPMPLDALLEPYLKMPLSFFLFSNMLSVFSPYQFNPSNFHPIREVLEAMIDIEKIKKQSEIDLFLCGTNVKTGKIRIFNNKDLSIDAVLASACLPKLFQAVEVESEYFWDGGYMGDPAIYPLIYNTTTRDIIILHTVPMERPALPKTVIEIDTRLREISFNSALMREMRAVAFVTKMIDQGWIKDEYKDQLKRVYVHSIRGDRILADFSLSTIFNTDWEFLLKLKDLGRKTADAWLAQHSDSVGKETSINFEDWL